MFSALRCILEELALVPKVNIISSEKQRYAENVCVNGIWQLALEGKHRYTSEWKFTEWRANISDDVYEHFYAEYGRSKRLEYEVTFKLR